MVIPTTEEILEDLTFFEDWEGRYQYIIDLGHDLPPMAPELQTSDRLVKGCQSNVWLSAEVHQGRLNFLLDSDALIVKGLLVLVLAAFNNRTPKDIRDFDTQDYFEKLDLYSHLSPTRGNGLRSVIAKIKALAAAHLADQYNPSG